MRKISIFYLFILFFLISCNQKQSDSTQKVSNDSTLVFKYAKNIMMERTEEGTKVCLKNPWKEGEILHTYYLVNDAEKAENHSDGTIVQIPIKRSVIFTAAHANLLEMLGQEKAIAGVADAKYMLIPDVHKRLKMQGKPGAIADCGDGMKPNIEKIIDIQSDGLFLSPFENSGGYGKLDEVKIPIIECADYMETSALGRAEWMKFYGLLFGCEAKADSLFKVMETNYLALKAKAKTSKQTRSVLPDRKTGSVWYMPGGNSSVGLLYKDANGKYAFSNDTKSGSLALPFETVLDKAGQADFWIMSYYATMNKSLLLAEYSGYAALKPFKTGEIYGCMVDKTPYFEEVSWRPDWLLQDLIQLFHPDLKLGEMRYYHHL